MVKRASRQMIERYYSRLTFDFDTNKRITSDIASVPSKRVRNKIAGYVTVSPASCPPSSKCETRPEAGTAERALPLRAQPRLALVLDSVILACLSLSFLVMPAPHHTVPLLRSPLCSTS